MAQAVVKSMDEAADAGLSAVRAMVAVASMPLAVFDASGACLAASGAFGHWAAADDDVRDAFSPDGVRHWTLVTRSAAEPLIDHTGEHAGSGLLAAMSHELRTPLNAVIGFAEILHQQVLGPIGRAEYADYAGHILRSGQHLLGLVNDILDFVRIDGGHLRLRMVTVDLALTVRVAMAALTPSASAAGVFLDTDLPASPVEVAGDEQRLRQVLSNVMGNAVKFTPAGGRVTVRLARAPDSTAVITVSDSGIGIDDGSLGHVFEPFWQADSGLDRLRAGAGIGLPLARELVRMHGGALTLVSRVGAGTRVTIVLPEGSVEDGKSA